MKNLIDLHTHTLASGHAYSTMMENIKFAAAKELSYLGLSDHAPSMPNTTTKSFFSNQAVIPSIIEDVHILKGVELNIMDENGTIDLDEKYLNKLDFAIASLHIPCFKPSSITSNTNAYLNVLKNKYVKVLGHPDDGRYPYNHLEVVKAVKEAHKVMEVNNSSLKPDSFRPNARENLLDVLALCVEYEVPIIMNSDAHFCFDIGNIENCLKLIQEVNFPDRLIINYHQELIDEYIIKKTND